MNKCKYVHHLRYISERSWSIVSHPPTPAAWRFPLIYCKHHTTTDSKQHTEPAISSQRFKHSAHRVFKENRGTLVSMAILMKEAMMVRTSLMMRSRYQPLMNSIRSPQHTERHRDRLKYRTNSCTQTHTSSHTVIKPQIPHETASHFTWL